MLSFRRTERTTHIDLLVYIGLGIGAGLLAAVLLSTLSWLRAILALGALGAGFFCFAAPPFGVYLLTMMMIAVWPYQLIKVLGAVVSASVLLWALTTRRSLIPRDGILLVQVLLTALIWLSAMVVRTENGFSIALNITSYLALSWMLSTFSTGPHIVRRVVGAMMLSGVIMAVIGLVQLVRPFVWISSATQYVANNPYQAGTSLLEALTHDGSLRMESLAGTPNFLALSMQMLLPFAAFWTVRQPTYRGRAIGMGMIALLTAAILLSYTRGVTLTTALVIIPLLAAKFGWRRSLPYLAAGVLVAVVVVLAVEPLRSRIFSTISEFLSKNNEPAWSTSIGWRTAVIPIAFRMILDHFWLGVGLGQQQWTWREYAPTYVVLPGTEAQLPIHNAYLQTAIEVGVPGLVLLLALLLVSWWRLRRVQQQFRMQDQYPMLDLAHASEVALVAMIVNNMMYPGLDRYRYFWVLIALIVAISRVAADQYMLTQRRGAPNV